MKLSGELRISRAHGSDCVTIEIADEASGCVAVTIEMMLTHFANALFSRAADVDFTIDDSGVLGATSEVKTELVPFNCYGHRDANGPKAESLGYRIPAAVRALKPFEVDGWRGRASDLFNGHNRVNDRPSEGGDLCQKVTFHRYLRDGKPIELRTATKGGAE